MATICDVYRVKPDVGILTDPVSHRKLAIHKTSFNPSIFFTAKDGSSDKRDEEVIGVLAFKLTIKTHFHYTDSVYKRDSTCPRPTQTRNHTPADAFHERINGSRCRQ